MGGTLKAPHVAATALTTGLYEPLLAQAGLWRFAADERSKHIVEVYRNLLQLRSGALQGRVLQRLVADYLWHQFVTDRDEAEESLFKYVAPLVPAEQRLIAAKGMLADHPLEKAELLRYTYSGEAKEGGDHGYRGSEADAVDSRNRDRQHEKDFGVHETPERECGEFASAVRRECANDSTPRQLRRS